MKKLFVVAVLLLSLVTVSFAQAQGVMYVSDKGALACSNSIVMSYLLLLTVQEDWVALRKAILAGLDTGDVVRLDQKEKVFHMFQDSSSKYLVLIRRQGDPRPLVSLYEFFK